MPRKGFDTAIRAAAILRRSRPNLVLAISGGGRDEHRLRRLVDQLDAPVRFLGRVANDDLPALYGCADVYTMLCRNRWGGLEQEGFGIVFLEAAACEVPQVAGDSGGAEDAVVDGVTGVMVRHAGRPARSGARPSSGCSTIPGCGARWARPAGCAPSTSSRTTGWPSGWERRWAPCHDGPEMRPNGR